MDNPQGKSWELDFLSLIHGSGSPSTDYGWADPEMFLPQLAGSDGDLWGWEESLPSVTQTQDFFQSLEEFWQGVGPAPAMVAKLTTEFVNVPVDYLRQIIQRVYQWQEQNHSPMETLVSCAQSLRPQWHGEDLQNFARPYVFAMRSNHCPPLPREPWGQLNEVKKTKLTMAIAARTLHLMSTDHSRGGA